MSKLKTSFLKTLFVTISTLFIFGCTDPVAPNNSVSTGNQVENPDKDSSVKPNKPNKPGETVKPENGEVTPEGESQNGTPEQPETPSVPENGGENNIPGVQPGNPEYSSEYGIRISLSSQGAGNISYDGKSLVIGQQYDLRGLAYENPTSLEDLALADGGDIQNFFEIEHKSNLYTSSYYLITPKETLQVGSKLKFTGSVSGQSVISTELSIQAKPSSGGGTIVIPPKPEGGNEGTVPPLGEVTTNPVYNHIQYNTENNPSLAKKEAYIIKHNFEKEKVYWLGGIEPPTESEFMDYSSIGQWEWEYDEVGNKIDGSQHKSDVTVPKFYVKDVDKNTNSEKPSWYNVIKSYSTEAPDKSMCWAMAAAGAMHWWFDYLGDDYTQKLFDIRRNRTDMPKTNYIFDEFKGDKIHYIPLDHQPDNSSEVAKRSGIGAYAVKSFNDVGGNSRDLFRLYFLNEDDKFGNNYKRGKSIGLLNGMGYNWGPGTNKNDNNDEKLWEYVPLVNNSRNSIVDEFKRAINEESVIVISQGNIPDNILAEDSKNTKAAHAIIVWGVIFDESEQNIVGLYVGDNNLKDGNLARVDLVYKQLSNDGGRYYYAAPYIKQDQSGYLKQTSIYAITKLLPPTDSIKNWINDMYTKVVPQEQ